MKVETGPAETLLTMVQVRNGLDQAVGDKGLELILNLNTAVFDIRAGIKVSGLSNEKGSHPSFPEMEVTVGGTALGQRGAGGIGSLVLGMICLRQELDTQVEILGGRQLDIQLWNSGVSSGLEV